MFSTHQHRLLLFGLQKHSSLEFVCFFKHTSDSLEPHNPALGGCLEVVGLKAVLPDLTQAHRSDSSTLGFNESKKNNGRRKRQVEKLNTMSAMWTAGGGGGGGGRLLSG